MNRSTRSVCAAACGALMTLAWPAAIPAATPVPSALDAAHQYPSRTTTSVMTPALRSAVEQALAHDPDAAWIEDEIIAADGQASDLFGFRVLVSGNTAFISAPAPGPRPGKVYVFTNSSGTWTETQQLTATPSIAPPPNWTDFFGWSLSLSGDSLLVGAPEVFNPMFGPVGAAYVFVRDGDTWVQQQELLDAGAGTFDWVGSAVALAGDTAFVGSPNHDGTQGTVYVFTRSGTSWSEGTALVASDGTSGDSHQFGGAVKFNGTTLLIGAPGPDYTSGAYAPGEAYVFTNSGGTWTETEILQPDDSADGDQFGFSLAIEGTTLLIGAPAADVGANVHQGAGYVFDGSGGSFVQTHKIFADDGVAYDQFGQSVAMSGDTALIGMWSHNDDPTTPPAPPKPGSVYLFSAARDSWTQSDKLTASDATDGDSFGWDVGVDGTTLLVGAQRTVGANAFQGAAYVYTPGDPPIANVTPDSLSFSLAPGASDSSPITIGNTGGSDLSFAIAEAAAGDCTNPSDVPWLGESPTGGSVAAGGSQDVTVTADATGLDPGSYSALVCITTNDRDNALVGVSVSLTVTADDTIFEDGFDGVL